MCLAVPMELVVHDGQRGVACLGEVRREVNLMLVPDVKIGDFVIIHAGCAISVLDRAEAQKTLDILRSAGPLGDET
jgi:hydrogenase expression/formation protein HypC